ncbi:MAG: alpha-L-rhamnosidase [Tannerella sp.]|jgi:hypothetical protein|nr:alpha-L-rhamnosidase [Tannerella sp.]
MIRICVLYTAILLGAQLCVAQTPAGSDTPAGLLCNLLSHPELSVITDRRPSFGWIVPAGGQTAYRILVSSSREAALRRDGDVWDSGKVKSTQSLHVVYSGSDLKPAQSYRWQVCTWNGEDKRSPFSAIQRFNTGNWNRVRTWKGESRPVQIPLDNDSTIWTFENRHPISFRTVSPVKSVQRETGVLFFDFGKAAFATASFTVTSPESQDITIRIGERAENDTINSHPEGGVIYREYPFSLQAGTHSRTLDIPRFTAHYAHSQTMHAHLPEVIPFRYMEIVPSDDMPVTVSRIEQHALHYLFNDSAAFFSSSDTLLNAIYELCRYSVKANTFNGDYAASQRERMMYEADCYIHQMSHYAVDREFAIARYSLENMIYHATWPTEWILHIPLMAWADYMHTGDTSLIARYYEEIKPKTLLALSGENHLISTRTGLQTEEMRTSIHYSQNELRDIVDWPQSSPAYPNGGETDAYDFRTYNTAVNAFHYRALTLVAQMAEILDKQEDALFYRDMAIQVKEAFNRHFIDPVTGIYTDGAESDHSSLHANMFALAFGLVPDTNRQSVIDFIKSKGMACGVYGANYLFEALYDAGEARYALDLLLSRSDRSWYNMLHVGSTMTTEAWDSKYKANNGWSHAWSASPAHIIPRKLMGVEPLTPGFEKMRIKPQPATLQKAAIRLPTIRGDVRLSFDNHPGESFAIEVEIPANTTAEVWLPQPSEEYTLTVDHVRRTGISERGFVGTEIASGKHTLTIAGNRKIKNSKP